MRHSSARQDTVERRRSVGRGFYKKRRHANAMYCQMQLAFRRVVLVGIFALLRTQGPLAGLRTALFGACLQVEGA